MPKADVSTEIAIARRLREWRESHLIAQAAFARALGIQPTTLWSYENGQVPVKARLAVDAWRKFNLSPAWLRMRQGPLELEFSVFGAPFERILRPAPREDFSHFYDHTLNLSEFAKPAGEAPSLLPELVKTWSEIGAQLERLGLAPEAVSAATQPLERFQKVLMQFIGWERSAVDNVSEGIHICAVLDLLPHDVDDLLERIRAATAAPGAKRDLAARLKIRQQQLSAWLSPKDKSKRPSADYALALLKWLAEVEHPKQPTADPQPDQGCASSQKETAAVASTQRRQKVRKSNPANEQDTPNRPSH